MQTFSSDGHSGRIRFAFCAAAALTLLLVASPLRAQVVATYDFEDGTAQGWTSFYNASTPVNTASIAHAGAHSLSTTTSAAGTGGPQINLTSVLQAGAQYTITGWVRLASGETATDANFTIQRSDTSPSCSGGTCYDTIGAYQTGVTADGWVQIG
ncbi:MAG TPA: carbohydrate binding domain-containing protein, partial [Acidobacteriaceae bacterium]|nr:carbohydrate binding domain-containing protein [Acidobacteriaceae bacterium]